MWWKGSRLSPMSIVRRSSAANGWKIRGAVAVLIATTTACTTPILSHNPVETSTAGTLDSVMYALPRGYVSLEIARDKDASAADSKISVKWTTAPIFAPDIDYIFALSHLRSSMSTDSITVEVEPNGLLKSVSTTTTSALPNIVKSLADFFANAAVSGISATTPLRVVPPDVNRGPFKIVAVFDPADEESLEKLQGTLNGYGVVLEVTPPIAANAVDMAATRRELCSQMICYRPVLPYRIVIQDQVTSGTSGAVTQAVPSATEDAKPGADSTSPSPPKPTATTTTSSQATTPGTVTMDGPSGASRFEAVYLLPNASPVAGIELVRRSLVENEFELTFTNGILTKARIEDPSAVQAALMLPIDALKAIVSIPSALFQFRIARDTEGLELQQSKALLEAQTELAKQELLLLQAQQSLRDAESAD